jgi:hypothetical protein
VLNEVRVYDVENKRTSVLFSAPQEQLALQVPGWSRDDAVIVHRSVPRPEQLFQIELLELTLDGGRRELASIGDSATPSVRVDARGGRLYLTRSVDGIHNVYMLSLRDAAARQLTANHAPGVSFSGIQPLQREAIVFAREEWKRDIWLLTTATRRQ